MAYSASHRFARIAATKIRPFANLIRGRRAGDAVELLKYVPNRGARMLEKVLKSAMSNAEDQGARNVDRMLVVDARANGGPMFKRIMPRARGMAYMIKRRFAHIDVAIDVPAVAKNEERNFSSQFANNIRHSRKH